jgi:hypothetical protein
MGLSAVGWPYSPALVKIHVCDFPKHTHARQYLKENSRLEMYTLKSHRQFVHAPKCRCIYLMYLMTSGNEFNARKPLGHLTVCHWVHLKLELLNSLTVHILGVIGVQHTPKKLKKKRIKLVCQMNSDTLRSTLKSWLISINFHLDSHSCIHPVSHPVYATGSTTHRTIIL